MFKRNAMETTISKSISFKFLTVQMLWMVCRRKMLRNGSSSPSQQSFRTLATSNEPPLFFHLTNCWKQDTLGKQAYLRVSLSCRSIYMLYCDVAKSPLRYHFFAVLQVLGSSGFSSVHRAFPTSWDFSQGVVFGFRGLNECIVWYSCWRHLD